MAQGRSRPAWAEIDLAAVAHNAAVLARLVAPAELCAVVKAHGYGHGGPAVARAALAGGAQRLAVALVDEGVELRAARRDGAGAAAQRVRPRRRRRPRSAYGLTPTLYSARASRPSPPRRRAAGRRVGRARQGRHRHAPGRRRARGPAGARGRGRARADARSSRACGPTCRSPTASRTRTAPYTEGQLDLFDRLVADLAADGVAVPVLHAANTAGAVAFPAPRHDMVRCGLGLYGVPAGRRRCSAAFAAQAGGDALRPAMSLKARVVAVRTLDGRASAPPTAACARCPERSLVATVPIGYADGVPARPLRRRLRGADRRGAPAAGRAW